MGDSCRGVHVFLGDDDPAHQATIASLVTVSALVSPPRIASSQGTPAVGARRCLRPNVRPWRGGALDRGAEPWQRGEALRGHRRYAYGEPDPAFTQV
jgi:hypothetical protein